MPVRWCWCVSAIQIEFIINAQCNINMANNKNIECFEQINEYAREYDGKIFCVDEILLETFSLSPNEQQWIFSSPDISINPVQFDPLIFVLFSFNIIEL